MPNILIIDDDTAVCASLRIVLRRAGFEALAANRPADAMAQLTTWEPDVVLLDMNFTIDTSGRQGLQTLRQLLEWDSKLPVILMTGWATVQLAVEGMKLGAHDFIAKPWDNKELLKSIRTALSLRDTSDSSETAAKGFTHIVGRDSGLLEVLATARQVATTDASVLITGESGTGKELVAEAIHAESQRNTGPFIKVNLGGLPESLFESEMFGHVKGAFTDAKMDRKGRFASADGGTIFLDEIGELPLANQVKLLRILQEKTFEPLGSSRQQRVDCRVISATNKDLATLVGEGGFREDLMYRINLIKVHLPALRDRPGDIPLLVEHFLQQLGENYQRPGLQLAADAREWLLHQTFPGNIRQLKNLVERTVLLSPQLTLSAQAFTKHHQQGRPVVSAPEALGGIAGDMTLEQLELQAIRRALSRYEYNITAAAKALGITRSALYRRLQKFDIPYAP